MLEHYQLGVRHGRYARWDESGVTVESGDYIDGEKAGRWISNFPNTEKPRTINQFSKGAPDGIQESYREDPHSLHERAIVENGVLKEVIRFDQHGAILP